MRKYLAALLITTPAPAMEPFSLFLTSDEQAQYQLPSPTDHNSLTLQAVMQVDDHQWAIWLNNERITPDNCPDHVQVQSVSPAEVVVIWQGTPLTLKLNEKIVLK